MLALDAAPLVDEGRDLPEAATPQAQSRLAAVAELLDAVGERWFDAETTVALRTALLAVWDREPEVVLDAATAAHVAGGICWAVGKANGLFRPQGERTMGRIKEALALHATISTYGKVVQRALVGYRDLAATGWWRPDDLPDLLPLGHRGAAPRRGPTPAAPGPGAGAGGAGPERRVSSTVDGRIRACRP